MKCLDESDNNRIVLHVAGSLATSCNFQHETIMTESGTQN